MSGVDIESIKGAAQIRVKMHVKQLPFQVVVEIHQRAQVGPTQFPTQCVDFLAIDIDLFSL